MSHRSCLFSQELPIFTRVAYFHKSCLFSRELPIFTRVAYFHLRLCHIFAFSCDQYVIIITCLAWRNGQSFSSVSVSMRAPEFGPASPRTWRGKFLSHMFKNVFRSSTHKHMSYLIHYILKWIRNHKKPHCIILFYPIVFSHVVQSHVKVLCPGDLMLS